MAAMRHLVPCPTCHRHVSISEPACPFCDAELDLAHTPAPIMPSARLGRAALFAFGATIAAGVASTACGSDGETRRGVDGGGGNAAVGPVYGVPAGGTAGDADSGGTAGDTNTGGVAGSSALYGAAPDP